MRTLWLVALVVVGSACNEMKKFQTSDPDRARIMTKKLAMEAYPQWAAAHPEAVCPSNIEALFEYVDSRDMRDPWGTPYRMLCGATLPAGVIGLGVESWGPDKKDNTPDDLRSWD